MKEIWKDIKGFDGLYQVSNLGQVKSLRYNKNMAFTVRSGYYNILLRKNGKRFSKQIHRLVAETFIPNPLNKPFVNHLDFNRKNNVETNLEWVTQKENVNWSINAMKHSKKCKNKLNEQYIKRKYNKYELTLKKKYIGLYNTLEEAVKVRNKLIEGDDYYK